MTSTNKLKEISSLAEELHKDSSQNEFTRRLKPILSNPTSKSFLIRLMDVAFRSQNYGRISDYVLRLFKKSDRHFVIFSEFEKMLVALYQSIGKYFPGISMPLMLRQINNVTKPILFFVGDSKFQNHAQKRKQENVRLNVNLIGESLIGEQEAADRIVAYRDILNQDGVDYISIKISTIYSQISSLAFEHTVETLITKLSVLYNEILKIQQETGKSKFINLDMEEYRDLHLTLETFKRTLSLPAYKNLYAGIVLQAYLPDSYEELVSLTQWAKVRTENGGAPIKIRIVKGANMEMELTESSLEDWPLAPYSSKLETDANYKKMISYALQSEHLKSVKLGIASHNIFDLSYALSIVNANGFREDVDFEMLEGMANETVSQLLHQNANVLLYTPIVAPENYKSAIAYLVRRLDEGTQDGNFLKEGFELKVGSKQWLFIQSQFEESLQLMAEVKSGPSRTQNRKTQKIEPQTTFENVANTDFTLKANRDWILEIKEKWGKPTEAFKKVIGLSASGIQAKRIIYQENYAGQLPWSYELASSDHYQWFLGLSTAWHLQSVSQRAELLRKAAVAIENRRGDLIAVAVTELGKTIAEVDVEVSEAIDFANFYAQKIVDYAQDLKIKPKEGVNLILSPWNFPVAIPIGGVFASLAAGKRVILKPSINAAATALMVSECLWEAGISQEDFAFLPIDENELDGFLSEGNVFDAVILTGSTDTAKFLLNRNPHLALYAETGGKNSTIITALADREQAIKNVVQSAFGNAGQKCSATSLLILEEEVFNDSHFKSLLIDATKSKYFGNPWDLQTQIGPLAPAISAKLVKLINNIPDENWLLKPHLDGDYFLSPGIIWDVKSTDFVFQNELFAPILSVVKAENLKEAIHLANSVPYGLTSGLESLDEEEINLWKSEMKAGNLYINRPTTGAIVQRQPFGGIKASSYGLGMKAGGDNYVLQFMHFEDKIDKSLQIKKDPYFETEYDFAQIRGQFNICRFIKPEKVFLLLDKFSRKEDSDLIRAFLKEYQINFEFITINGLPVDCPDSRVLFEWNDILPEMNENCKLRTLNKERLPLDFLRACNEKAIYVNDRPVNANPRLEMLNYLDEQSISHNYHRYGNLLGIQNNYPNK